MSNVPPSFLANLKRLVQYAVNQTMSKEKAREFYEFSKNDDELQERLKAANSSAIVIQIAAEKGYELTESEWQIVMQDAISEDELSEEELLAVAGGLHVDVDTPREHTHIHT